jgi:hypothetical protein
MNKFTFMRGGEPANEGSDGSTKRENRIGLRFSIQVSGFDRFGKYFSERSETTNVSRNGCKFRVHTEIKPDSVVAIRVVRSKEPNGESAPILFHVSRTEPVRDGWSVGAAKLLDGDPWSVDFAELDRRPKTID